MHSLFRNSIFNFFSQIIIFLSGTFLSIVLARILGPGLMGQYSYWMWIIGTGSVLITLGIPRSLTKFISQYQSDNSKIRQIISRVLIFEGRLLLLVLIVGVLASFFVPFDKVTYLIILFTLLISALNILLGSSLQGLQKFDLFLRVNSLISPINFILTFSVLTFSKSLVNLLIINFAVSIFTLVIFGFLLKKYWKFNTAKFQNSLFNDIKTYAWSTSLIVFLDLILMERSEVFFLNYFSTLEQVAFYSIAFGSVAKIMTLIPGAVSGVLMPRVSMYHGEQNPEAIKQTYFSATRYLSLITLPIIFAGLVLIDLPVKIFYGNEYLQVIPVIQILLISGGLSAIVAAASSVLFGTGGQSFILKLAIVAAAINIVLDILLIPNGGALGAAAANATAQIIGVIAGTFYITKIKRMDFPRLDVLKILIASLVASIVIYLLKSNLVNIFSGGLQLLILFTMSVFVFMICFIIGLFYLKFFKQNDYKILQRIIGKVGFKNEEN